MKSFKLLVCALVVLVMLPSCDLSQTSVDKTNQLFGIWELNKRKTNNGTESTVPYVTLTFYKSGQYVKYWRVSDRYEEGVWMYDGNKMLTLSHGEIHEDYYVEVYGSTLKLYMGNTVNGTWIEETYIKPSEEVRPQGGTAGAPARKY